MRRGFRAGCVLALLSGAPVAFAQSVSIDSAQRATDPEVPAPAAQKPAPKPVEPPELVTPPRAVATPVEYPAQGHGAREVVLELTISSQGTVTGASVVSGATPFSESALDASKTWLFEPATRGAATVAAKIRFAVYFVPPPGPPPNELFSPSCEQRSWRREGTRDLGRR